MPIPTIPPHPNTQFDDAEFLGLIQGSLSLSIAEKIETIENVARLRQDQVDSLISIFKEEVKRFEDLYEKNKEQIDEIRLRVKNEWDEYVNAETALDYRCPLHKS